METTSTSARSWRSACSTPGLLGAICISLASSWAFGEIFGWAHSLNKKIKEAPWFYACYFFTLITAGLVVLIPGAPLVLITLFVQVIAVTLLPAALVFLILLLNDRADHGGVLQQPLAEHHRRLHRRVHRRAVHALRDQRHVPEPVPVRRTRPCSSILRRLSQKIGDINQRYREPRIEMSGAVKVAPVDVLRIYLCSWCV